MRLDLASTREAAIALQGMELLAAGGELDALPFYRVGDLIGLRVETAGGRQLGEVSDVLETPAHEILEVTAPGGASLLVPLVDELVTVDEEAASRASSTACSTSTSPTKTDERPRLHAVPAGVRLVPRAGPLRSAKSSATSSTS